MGEFLAKAAWVILAGAFAIGAWVTNIQFTQLSHGKAIDDLQGENATIRKDIKNIGENTAYIRGWVENQNKRR